MADDTRVETWKLYRSRKDGKVVRMERVHLLEEWDDPPAHDH